MRVLSVARRVAFENASLIAFLVLLFAARSSLADHYYVPSGSMQHTLQPGDRILVDKRAYGLRLPFLEQVAIHVGAPARGDVVIFDSPVDGTRLVKRVVAVSGDLVALNDGKLFLNGKALYDEEQRAERFGDRVASLDLADGGGADIPLGRIPEGYALTLGDHRGRSADGRTFGMVSLQSIYGRALAVFYRRDEGFSWQPL